MLLLLCAIISITCLSLAKMESAIPPVSPLAPSLKEGTILLAVLRTKSVKKYDINKETLISQNTFTSFHICTKTSQTIHIHTRNLRNKF